MNAFRFAALAPMTLLIGALPSQIYAADTHKDPIVDVTVNPGCGVKGLDRDQKVARNKHLAEYYFAGWTHLNTSKYNHQYRFEDHDCFADGATFRMGYGLDPVPPDLLDRPYRNDKGDWPKASDSPFIRALPDWGTVPGTLRIIPWENGVYFIMRFGGTTRTGQHIEYWETDTIVVNDDGKITHWEGYNDTMGVDELFKVVFGKGLKEMGSLQGLRQTMKPQSNADAATKPQ